MSISITPVSGNNGRSGGRILSVLQDSRLIFHHGQNLFPIEVKGRSSDETIKYIVYVSAQIPANVISFIIQQMKSPRLPHVKLVFQ